MDVVRELIKFLSSVATLCVVVFAVLRMFFVDAYTIPHNGMAPTLVMGDEVLAWRNATPDMANVMLCDHPSQAGATILGRVIAFPGHTVSTDRFGHLTVDTERTTTEGEGSVHFYDESVKKMFVMDLGELEYHGHHGHKIFSEQGMPFSIMTNTLEHGLYLLGDNRAHPWDDSREIGEIKPELCTRQVFLRLRPAPSRNDDLPGSWFTFIR